MVEQIILMEKKEPSKRIQTNVRVQKIIKGATSKINFLTS